MINMSNLAEVLQIVESVAVAMGLFFIAWQIRETRRIAAANSYQAAFQPINQFYSNLFASPELNALYRRGRRQPHTLSLEERSRFVYACAQWFSCYENLCLQHTRGLIPDQYYAAWSTAFKADLENPGFVLYWRLERETYADEFRRIVDEILLAHGISDVTSPGAEHLLSPTLSAPAAPLASADDPERLGATSRSRVGAEPT